jgi:peptidoglycan-associated lipoprotein
MMDTRRGMRRAAQSGVLLVLVGLTGCGYAKRRDVDRQFDRLRADMQAADENLDGRVTQLDGRVNAVEGRTAALERELQTLRNDFDTKITELEGKLAFNVPVNFEFDRAEVRPSDRAVLRRFANVVRDHYPNAIITVEGFTDRAGSTEYNRRLGMRRAEAVKAYLVSEGLNGDRIRAVSYGKDENRLINRAYGPGAGMENRRVSLVIDYSDHRMPAGGRVITSATELELDR